MPDLFGDGPPAGSREYQEQQKAEGNSNGEEELRCKACTQTISPALAAKLERQHKMELAMFRRRTVSEALDMVAEIRLGLARYDDPESSKVSAANGRPTQYRNAVRLTAYWIEQGDATPYDAAKAIGYGDKIMNCSSVISQLKKCGILEATGVLTKEGQLGGWGEILRCTVVPPAGEAVTAG